MLAPCFPVGSGAHFTWIQTLAWPSFTIPASGPPHPSPLFGSPFSLGSEVRSPAGESCSCSHHRALVEPCVVRCPSLRCCSFPRGPSSSGSSSADSVATPSSHHRFSRHGFVYNSPGSLSNPRSRLRTCRGSPWLALQPHPSLNLCPPVRLCGWICFRESICPRRISWLFPDLQNCFADSSAGSRLGCQLRPCIEHRFRPNPCRTVLGPSNSQSRRSRVQLPRLPSALSAVCPRRRNSSFFTRSGFSEFRDR